MTTVALTAFDHRCVRPGEQVRVAQLSAFGPESTTLDVLCPAPAAAAAAAGPAAAAAAAALAVPTCFRPGTDRGFQVCGPDRPGPTRPGPARTGPARSVPARPGPARPGPVHGLWTKHGPAQPGPDRPGPSGPDRSDSA